MEGLFRRRNLPHWDVPGKAVFVTGCLNGCFNSVVHVKIEQYRESLALRPKPSSKSEVEWHHHLQKLLFAYVDNLLDGECPVTHLSDPAQAKVVVDAFLHFENVRYQLLAFVVMPSHHHWLFIPNEAWADEQAARRKAAGKRIQTAREMISHSVQSYTANQCNQIRGHSGAYWQQETFDHWARTNDEVEKIIRYIENNPVKAGLVKRAEDYPWSSAYRRKNP